MKRKANVITLIIFFILTALVGCGQSVSESRFMDVFKQHYREGNYEKMLQMTAAESIAKYGKTQILSCYKTMDFVYDMKYLSAEQDGQSLVLRYEVELLGIKGISKVRVIREGGQLKVMLRSLDTTWGRCVQEGV